MCKKTKSKRAYGKIKIYEWQYRIMADKFTLQISFDLIKYALKHTTFHMQLQYMWISTVSLCDSKNERNNSNIHPKGKGEINSEIDIKRLMIYRRF